jgi:aminoglycoside phosphotransferase (APT) family kinase protein
VRATGVPTPLVHGFDASRTRVPFAWQALERIPAPDLNHWHKLGALDHHRIAFAIGAAVAGWQGIRPSGFGPFDIALWRGEKGLKCYHDRYGDHFRLHLERHLDFLAERGFLTAADSAEILRETEAHRALLDLRESCLVHKDLALWNILGSETEIAAFIDFDDAIGGDPMDDLSLLACFHDADFLVRAVVGYESGRTLPDEFRRRFWLHLLRNLIVKAVIRVGAGYFDRTDGFFLIGSGASGADLKAFTQARWRRALLGLRENHDIGSL